MKNKLNILLLFSFILALTLLIWMYYQTFNRVGDITFDSKMDNPEFIMCYEERIPQYYSIGTSYEGGNKSVKKELKELVNNLDFIESGYLTYRFVVNCKNKTGRFRVKMVNTLLKENSFDSKNVQQIQESIKKLRGWKAGKVKEKSLDSYYQLNFKIENGKIADIF